MTCQILFVDHNLTLQLLMQTWEHWRKGRALQITDPFMGESSSINEVLRCIQIGLLFVQEIPANRSHMSSIFHMLHGCSMALQEPLQLRSTAAGMVNSTASFKLADLNFGEEFACQCH